MISYMKKKIITRSILGSCLFVALFFNLQTAVNGVKNNSQLTLKSLLLAAVAEGEATGNQGCSSMTACPDVGANTRGTDKSDSDNWVCCGANTVRGAKQ
jgi:hypothetical protein